MPSKVTIASQRLPWPEQGEEGGALWAVNVSQLLRKTPQWQQKEMVLAGERVPPSGHKRSGFCPCPSQARF